MIFNYFVFRYVHFNVHQLLNVMSLCSETYNTFNMKLSGYRPLKFAKDLASYLKAFQLQACTGCEGSRRLRLPDFKTIGT